MQGSVHELVNRGLMLYCVGADNKFNMVISSLEGLTDVLKTGFADVAAMKDQMERVLPKLTNQAADMGSSSKVKLSKVEVRQTLSYSVHSAAPLQRGHVTHCNTPPNLPYLQGSLHAMSVALLKLAL